MRRSDFWGRCGSGLAACLLLAACTAGLAPDLKREITAEAGQLPDSRRQVELAQAAVDKDLAGDPQLFQGAAAPEQWQATLRAAAEQLNGAARADQTLQELARLNRADSKPRADRLLAEEQRLRTSAVAQSKSVAAEADRWVTFKASLPSKLDDLKREYANIHERDLTALKDAVRKAEVDWPAKKPFLEDRLVSLQEIPGDAEKQWKASESARQDAAAGSAKGSEIATLIQTGEALSGYESKLSSDAGNLRELSGQLYDSWDKILTDLDTSNFENDRLYRERIKTIRTHISDPASKQRTTSSSEQWVTVSEPAFRQVRNDIGMAIAHKDAGLFDYEAQTTPQPPGFAYIASEQQGSNQYGYWSHDGGPSVWHWLPEYLILRELLWNHDYHPIIINEYRGYQIAQSSGRTFYGQTSPAAPPKYGTAGTFTASHYAGSKYVQSGGFRSSAYASDRGNHAAAAAGIHSPNPGAGFAPNDGSGKRFGAGASAPSGRRFGQPHSAGRSFGRRR